MAECFLMGHGGKKLVGTAVVGDVLAGKTFSNATSNKLTGTMTNRGKVDHQLVINGSFTIPQGYHDGTGTVFQSVGSVSGQTITPGTAPQTILGGQYLSSNITVEGDTDLISANIKAGANIFGIAGKASVVETSDATTVAGDILSGKTAYVNGSKITGSIPSKGAATITPGVLNQTISAGQYLSGAQTIAGDPDLISYNIRAGVNIFGVQGNSKVIDTTPSTTTSALIEFYDTQIYITIQLAGITSFKISNRADIEWDSTDESVALINGEPYPVSVSVGSSFTLEMEAWYPIDIWPAGPGNFTATVISSSTTATSASILSGYIGYVNGVKITGTMPNMGTVAHTLTTQGASYTVPVGYHSGTGKVTASFSNLSAGNVKKGVNIGGVVGTVKEMPNMDGIGQHVKSISSNLAGTWYGPITSGGSISALFFYLTPNVGSIKFTATDDVYFVATTNKASIPTTWQKVKSIDTWDSNYHYFFFNPNKATITIQISVGSASFSGMTYLN